MTTANTKPNPVTQRFVSRNIGHFEISGKVRSYITRERLEVEVARRGFGELRHFHYQLPSGRWTAIFHDRRANAVIFQGFMWMG